MMTRFSILLALAVGLAAAWARADDEPAPVLPPPRVYISSFGQDAAGELYVCGFDRLDGTRGRIYRLVED